jgi:hypothetical protein
MGETSAGDATRGIFGKNYFDDRGQENVVLVALVLKQENANEDVEPHAHIDGGDIAIELHLL